LCSIEYRIPLEYCRTLTSVKVKIDLAPAVPVYDPLVITTRFRNGLRL